MNEAIHVQKWVVNLSPGYLFWDSSLQMFHFDSCQLSSIWLALDFKLLASDWPPCPVKAYFYFYVGKCDILHQLTYGGKMTSFSSQPEGWSADAWFWQLSIHRDTNGLYNWKASVNICARSNVTFDIGLHVVGVWKVCVHRLCDNQIFLHE